MDRCNDIIWNIRGRLRSIGRRAVMGVINVTPDSFHAESRREGADAVATTVKRMAAEGASIVDIGACSTRPGFEPVSEDVEMARVVEAVEAARWADTALLLSVDTFRASVAEAALHVGADIVNDVSGLSDPDMLPLLAESHAPYVLTHSRWGDGSTDYDDVTADVIAELSGKVADLHLAGVADVAIDPGLGFAKTVQQNYRLVRDLAAFKVLGHPILVGASRKSMLTKPLGISPADALEATTALNALALDRGAAILRVHDVKPAVQAIKVYEFTIS